MLKVIARKFFKAALPLFLFLQIASVSHAQHSSEPDIYHRWGVGLNFALALPSEEDADMSLYYGGSVTYGVWDRVALQVDLGYVEFSEEAFDIDYGDLEGIPLLLSAQWRHPFNIGTSPSAWYLVGGIGAVFWNFENSNAALGMGVPVDVDAAFAFKLGTGLDIFFTEHFAWNVEASYIFTSSDVDLRQPGTTDVESVGTDFGQVVTGFKYFF